MMKVFIADDSILIRNVVKEILGTDGGIAVIGEAANGELAVSKVLELKPDIVIMDMDMPVMNGLEATSRITRRSNIPVLLFTNNTDPELPFRALERGAAEFMRKPPFNDLNRPEYVRMFTETLRTIAGRYRGRIFYSPEKAGDDYDAAAGASAFHSLPEAAAAPSAMPGMVPVAVQSPAAVQSASAGLASSLAEAGRQACLADSEARPRIIALGASTGGPQAVARFLSLLGGPAELPLVIVQHIETGFDKGYADWLSQESGLTVRLARAGERPVAGIVYVAPTDFHLVFTAGVFGLDDGEKLLNQKPAVDALFKSAAEQYGRHVLAVLLTGMGTDGANGCLAVKAAGGVTLVQDEASSLIYGMPRAAVERGAACHVLPLDAIGHYVACLMERFR